MLPDEEKFNLIRPELDNLASESVETGMEPSAQDIQNITVDALRQNAPPVVEVDDFDVHEIHIEIHNQFRMSQEYEQLEPEVQLQFDQHVEMHEQMHRESQQQALIDQLLGTGPSPESGMEEAPPEEAPQEQADMPAPPPTPDL